MTRLSTLLLGVGLLTNHGVAGRSEAGSIQGVWQTLEVRTTGPGARTIAIPEPRPNLTIITAKHYCRVAVESEGPRMPVDAPRASADELRAVWGPFAGEAGTYEIKGNVITMHPVAAKNPAAMAPGAFTTWSFALHGDTLVVTLQSNQSGPVASPVTVKSVRVE
jgi:hypothetical protein